jgi:hypothetical protein
LLSAEW